MASACDFPDELLTKPLGYVGLTGLDTQYNAMHKSIWDTFSINRRQDKVLNIKLLPGDAEFPAKRTKQRSSYEFYIPKGILKRNWMSKHLYHLPALVVIFYDLDWNDPCWKEKQTECASRVAVIKSSLQGRSTKVAVVLIQKNMPLPPGEDPQAAQRAQAICQACDFQSNSLFVLPFGDHLLGYITRLEGAFYEILQNYYNEEAKFVKQHKELLNKSQHQLLYIRHQFKVAFYSELKQDSQLALKHYKQAYQYTLETKLTDVNQLEVKLVAGFLNYKICRISFQLNVPLDAISQFRKHIDYFKMSTGNHQLIFEHCAWMAKQFSLFGDLFHDAIKNGLQAIQTQHPGFYYQQAANYTMLRMKYCKSVCKYSEATLDPQTYLLRDNLEFYGQRPWRQFCQANEAPDPAMEQIGILSLQAEELQVEHYWIIIPLLSSAVAQFREYKSVRMKLFLMVQMGQEYFNAKDYSKALTLFSRVMPYYRGERWWNLLTSVLVTALRCAFLTASLQEYITICLELMGKHCIVTNEEKTRIQLNLQRVVQQSCPESESNCDESSVEAAKLLWKETFQKNQNDICYIDMENLASFVECRAAFGSDTYYLDEVAVVKVYLRSVGAYPIQFSEIGLSFSNPNYNSSCVKKNEELQKDLSLESGKVQSYSFSFVLSAQDVAKKLEIKQIYLRLGESTVLRWKGAGLDANISPSFDSSNYGGERIPIKYNSDKNIIWESVTISPFTDVLAREGKVVLLVNHNSPSLLDEFYPLVVEIHNKEEATVTNTKLIVRLENPEGKEKSATLYLDEKDGGDNVSGLNQVEFDLEDVPADTQIKKVIHLKSQEAGVKEVVVKISYNIEVLVGEKKVPTVCSCGKEEVVKIDTHLPVSFSVKVSNMMLLPTEKIYFDQPFNLSAYIKCTSPWPVHLISSELVLSNDFRRVDDEYICQVADIRLKENEIAGECHCLIVPITQRNMLQSIEQVQAVEKSIFVGSYILRWKRVNGDHVTQSKFNLPLANAEFAPLSIVADIPANGCLDEPLICHYTISNLTHLVQEVEAAIESSDFFMLAGNSQVQIRILPHDQHTLSYSIYPLACGELMLPKLHINLPQHHTLKTDFLTQQKIPTHVFIKPNVISMNNPAAIEVT